jgi:tRNA-dihydrouridine synthase B
MSGVTDLPFRRLAMRYGAGLVVSEMVACESAAAGSEEARLRAEGEGLDVHVVQLAGRDPAAFAHGVRIAEAAGAHVIDINMGCPAKRVTNGYAGSALMREPDLALRIVEATGCGGARPGDTQDAAWLGHQQLERAGDCPPCGRGRRATRHRARPNTVPVL